MKWYKLLTAGVLLFSGSLFTAHAQETHHYDLVQLLKKDQLLIEPYRPGQPLKVSNDTGKPIVTGRGFAWLKGVNFKEGTIDIDLRGRNLFQQSFLGIVFHAVDTVRYNCVYFRPFNFHSTDTLRRKHTVQYTSDPEYTWDRLRNEHPLVYESSVSPEPQPEEWFHATIVVKGEWVTVYVNHSKTPSLKVKKLDSRRDGMIGLWSSRDGDGDFGDLSITQ